jgi:hypothetical protein
MHNPGYNRRKEDPEFAAAWADAVAAACDELEKEARRRATRRKAPSDTLLIFLLKAYRPRGFREKVDVRHKGACRVEVAEEIVDAGGVRSVLNGVTLFHKLTCSPHTPSDRPWTTSAASAARTPTVPWPASAARAT